MTVVMHVSPLLS